MSHPLPVRTRRATTVAALTTVIALLAVLVAGPASAHPFFRGGEAPVDSLASLTLAMAHGCASETAGGGEPTTEVSMEVPAWMRVVEVVPPAGWRVGLEEADGRVEVVTWTADVADEPAPEFDLDVVVSGDVGDERFVRIFQACGDLVERWVGTPDEPADDPAVRLTLIAADPDRPAPPEPAPEPEPEAGADGGDDDGAAVADTDDAPGDDGDAAGEEPGADDEPAVDAAAADPASGEGAAGWLVPVAVMVVLLAVGATLLARRARAGKPTA